MTYDVQVEQDRDVQDVVVSADVEVGLDFEVEVIQVPEQGPPGPAGTPGPAGPPSTVPGPPGSTIRYGTENPTGHVGNDGDFYINTTTNFIYGPKISGVWPPGISLIGADGADGDDGNTILYGTGDPFAGLGVDGNFYINTTTHFLFGPKAVGAWPAGTSLVGPAGPEGPIGPIGPPGPGIAEAPIDGNQYARKDAAWAIIALDTGGDVDPGAVRFDSPQSLTTGEQTQARDNIDAANEVHTHVKADITDFAHTHLITDITGLQTALDGKAALVHTHTKSQITDFAHTHTKAEITDFAHVHAGSDITRQMSIDADASGLKLVGDVAAPGNNKVYGTSAAGVRGWKDDPAGGGVGREVLTANRDYFVSTGGSDSANGLTVGTPFLTVQKAIDVAVALDLSLYAVRIKIADGTYATPIVPKSYVGVGPITIEGNVTTPANVLISIAGNAIHLPAVIGKYVIDGVKITTSGVGYGILAENDSVVDIGRVNFGICASAAHIGATNGALVRLTNNYTISGNSNSHLYANNNGMIIATAALTATLTGAPAFSGGAFVTFLNASDVDVTNVTWSGAATGAKFNGTNNSVGIGFGTLPGDTAGLLTSGARCNATPFVGGVQQSITADASGLKLVGDVASPGNNQVYGTSAAGVRGWKADPTGTLPSNVALLNAESQSLSGGAIVSPKALGTLSGATITVDPSHRPMQYILNNGVGTVSPGGNQGQCTLYFVNTGGGGPAPTFSGWGKVDGTYEAGSNNVVCSVVITGNFSYISIVKVN